MYILNLEMFRGGSVQSEILFPNGCKELAPCLTGNVVCGHSCDYNPENASKIPFGTVENETLEETKSCA
jgi:hypothetical protein